MTLFFQNRGKMSMGRHCRWQMAPRALNEGAGNKGDP